MNRIISIALLLALHNASAATDLLRCGTSGTQLVYAGDTTYDVKKKCGTPDSTEDGGYVKQHEAYVHVVRYIYDFGHGQFLHILEFRNGKLYRITDGPRN